MFRLQLETEKTIQIEVKLTQFSPVMLRCNVRQFTCLVLFSGSLLKASLLEALESRDPEVKAPVEPEGLTAEATDQEEQGEEEMPGENDAEVLDAD